MAWTNIYSIPRIINSDDTSVKRKAKTYYESFIRLLAIGCSCSSPLTRVKKLSCEFGLTLRRGSLNPDG